MIDSNPHYTTREIADVLLISKSNVENYLHQLGYVSRLDVWVPHELKEAHLIQRISISDSLGKREKSDPFLKRMVTGDEKWIFYNNITCKRSWGQRSEPPQIASKAGLYPSKIMLSIWWDWKNVVYYKLLPKNKTINSDVYCNQLDKLNAAIHEKRPELVNRKGVVFHHDNAKPHTSLQTRQKILALGWDVL
ncbi:histone-lysine N-methyltransferase SETMAR-like [Temnothorax curvispinosus]|uniref:Histone-lysine N-methyltransferase SETMAR-like n=1 Tax=Temnothorax curvispinosus TaxID=300111 RepID=A0A6J1RD97_9HYME|nr:histone-lysine N-methyltransferase SETMAR-like [Temnothorax curvispinosus]